jgi:hypothetical protein
MSENITRRNLLGVTGAGLALSACDGWWPSGQHGAVVTPFGTSPDWGDSPTAPAPADRKFEPNHIALVHVELLKDWEMLVNYTSLDLPSGSTDQTRLNRAAVVFTTKSNTVANGKKARFRDLKLSKPNDYKDVHYFAQHGGVDDYDDFSNFRFASQTEIFFFFDSPNIGFGSPLIAATELTSNGSSCAKNYSFYGGALVNENDPALQGLKGKGRILRVRNYVMDQAGKTITTPVSYSLNIQLSVKNDSTGGGRLPIIFDPDTGNGSGYEP